MKLTKKIILLFCCIFILQASCEIVIELGDHASVGFWHPFLENSQAIIYPEKNQVENPAFAFLEIDREYQNDEISTTIPASRLNCECRFLKIDRNDSSREDAAGKESSARFLEKNSEINMPSRPVVDDGSTSGDKSKEEKLIEMLGDIKKLLIDKNTFRDENHNLYNQLNPRLIPTDRPLGMSIQELDKREIIDEENQGKNLITNQYFNPYLSRSPAASTQEIPSNHYLNQYPRYALSDYKPRRQFPEPQFRLQEPFYQAPPRPRLATKIFSNESPYNNNQFAAQQQILQENNQPYPIEQQQYAG